MRATLSFVFALSLAASAAAQSFECQPVGPFQPVGTAADCENATSNNLGAGTGITNIPRCGYPTSGNQYGFVQASSLLTGAVIGLAPGGQFARPFDQFSVSELLLPVPPGSNRLTFHWNFFSNEANLEPNFRDGMDISIVDGAGNRLVQIVSHDTTNAAWAPSVCTTIDGLVDTLADGSEITTLVLPALPNVADLSIVCFNGGDNQFSSAVAIDCVFWNEQELGNLLGPRIVDLAPATSFVLGGTTSLQVQAGVPFIEGFTCCVVQLYDANLPYQVPSFAGDLYIYFDRPMIIYNEALLGGSTFGAGKGPVKNLAIPLMPDICGAGAIFQGYVVTEFGLNPTFTTAVLGFLH